VVGFALISALLALNPPGGIVPMTLFSGSLYAVCFFPAVLIGLYWRRGSWLAVLASMGIGIVVLLTWMWLGYGRTLHELFPALAASVTTYVVCAWRTPRDLRIGAPARPS
jgi:sodium/proline symporter